MGCYGIGVSRLISAVIEQNHDKDGIIWPAEVAPYKVVIMPLDVADKNTMDLALALDKELKAAGTEPLLDDRDERPGVKFKDADLLGLPWQVIIGKNALKDGSLEIKSRRTQAKIIRPRDEALKYLLNELNG
jgi:prolyl-tRNA synthetase